METIILYKIAQIILPALYLCSLKKKYQERPNYTLLLVSLTVWYSVYWYIIECFVLCSGSPVTSAVPCMAVGIEHNTLHV